MPHLFWKGDREKQAVESSFRGKAADRKKEKLFYATLQDEEDAKRVIAEVWGRGRFPIDFEYKWIRRFVQKLVKGRKKKMDTDIRVNQVKLAGQIQRIFGNEKVARVVVDVGSKSWISFLAFDKKLVAECHNYEEGEYIQVVGYVSQSKNKKTDDYETIVVASELKTRSRGTRPVPKVSDNRRKEEQEDIPF